MQIDPSYHPSSSRPIGSGPGQWDPDYTESLGRTSQGAERGRRHVTTGGERPDPGVTKDTTEQGLKAVVPGGPS